MNTHTSTAPDHKETTSPQRNLRTINITKARKGALWSWSLVVIAQCLIWPSIEGFISAITTLIGGGLGLTLYLRRNILLNYPVSVSMLLGYITYYFLLPPLATIAEGKPLVNNLVNPTLTLGNALICFLALSVAHLVYRKSKALSAPKIILRDKLYSPLGFFHTPSNIQLMLMGTFGLMVMMLQTFSGSTGHDSSASALGKFAQAFQPLANLPYCILVRGLMGKEQRIDKKWLYILAAYTAILLLIMLGKNSRGEFFIGLASIFIAYTYGLLSGLIPAKPISSKKIITITITVLLLSGPVTDLATSMVVVRGLRSDISALDLAAETARVYQDKEALNAARVLSSEKITDWDETYIDNVFLSRLSNLKYTDNSLALATGLNSAQIDYMRSIELQRTISILPLPVISAFGFNTDKTLATSGSGGDFLYAAATGNSSVIGGFRTGSILGSGYALFGWFYPIIFGAICLVVFPIVDASVKIAKEKSKHSNSYVTKPIFNCFTIAIFFSWFFYLTSAATGTESMSELANYILRGWLQALVIYLISYWLSRTALRLVSKRTIFSRGSNR